MTTNSSQASIINSLTKENREKLKAVVQKVDASLTNISSEREFMKGLIVELAEGFPLDRKTIRRIAKTFHKASFNAEKSENAVFEELYENLYPTV